MSASIELRLVVEGECDHGPKFPEEERRECIHRIECDWGLFGDPPLYVADYENNTCTVENVAPLILVARTFVDDYDRSTVAIGRITSIHDDDLGRRFMTIAADNGSWIWELFDAHWGDGYPHCHSYVGRWPD